jgi:hypothetical protein
LRHVYLGNFYCTLVPRRSLKEEEEERRSLNGKKKRPLLNFGACKITFLFFSFEANKKNLLHLQKNTTTARPRDITQSDPRQKRTL